ncbi:MAG: bis-aminopropyl spermidine synthase family protein [Pseudonocardiaceae bacterium]
MNQVRGHQRMTQKNPLYEPRFYERTEIILALAEEVRALRPTADMAIDQCHVDSLSLSRRLLAMCASRPMTQTLVAFVGDDDLASVALLRLAPPEQLLLLDIDERIITLLHK